MGNQAHSVDAAILRRIRRHGQGWVFVPADFLDLGSRTAIGLALMRHARAGGIRQLARGLYDYPRRDAQLGLLSPPADAIVRALAGRDATRLQPSGAYAAHLLGLSDQVPMKMVSLSDGPTRKVVIGKQHITLRRTTPRNMATAGRTSGTVIQALRWLGKRHVDDSAVAILRQRLSPGDRRQLLKDLRYAPAWIGNVMRRVTKDEA